MHGLVTSGHRLRQRLSARRRFRHGQRAAAIRAFTGARLYLNCAVPTAARERRHDVRVTFSIAVQYGAVIATLMARRTIR